MRTGLMAALGLIFGAAASAADVPASADLATLPRYPQARIVDYRQEAVPERIYPRDSVRRISGRLRMAAQAAASGQLTTITYRLPETHAGIEAFDQARVKLLEEGAELLYWCEGRDCGASSLWANAIFGRSTLYGPDAQQAYLLARLREPADRLIALYGITRGNGRPYLHVEQLVPEQPLGDILPNAATLLRQLRSAGELRLAGLADEPVADWGALLASMLRLDSTLRVTIAGRAAPAWRDALIAERISARRLELDDSDESGLTIRLLR